MEVKMSGSAQATIGKLLAEARQGDRRALNQLFGACRSYVAVLAENQVDSRLKVKVDPSDLVQQTLLEAYKGFARFQGGCEAEWLAWLRGILDHNAADFVRHYRVAGKRAVDREVKLEGAAQDSTPGFDPSDGAETPVEELIRNERELQLADAIAKLDDDQRTVILLRNLQRLPFDQVAERMRRSRPAVQMLWLRALRKLHSLLPDAASSVRAPS
jgi:RNA polymerase sigma-70 factor, ECF subfamily